LSDLALRSSLANPPILTTDNVAEISLGDAGFRKKARQPQTFSWRLRGFQLRNFGSSFSVNFLSNDLLIVVPASRKAEHNNKEQHQDR